MHKKTQKQSFWAKLEPHYRLALYFIVYETITSLSMFMRHKGRIPDYLQFSQYNLLFIHNPYGYDRIVNRNLVPPAGLEPA